MPTGIEVLLEAIVADDLQRCRELLKGDPDLVNCGIARPKLYQSKIFHWMYVGDTALHLAAAGHRAAIVELLPSAGADPNSANNHRRSGPLHYAADGCPGAVHWNANDQVRTIERLLDAGAQSHTVASSRSHAVRGGCEMPSGTRRRSVVKEQTRINGLSSRGAKHRARRQRRRGRDRCTSRNH